MKSAEDGLCCCEYINDDGHASHLLASFCNCEALDSICDRCMKCEKIEPSLLKKLRHTVIDRMRLPWIGGAVKLHPHHLLSAVSVPIIILLASISLTSSFIMYIVFLPTFLFSIHRLIRKDRRTVSSELYMSKKDQTKPSVHSQFYPSFLISSVCWLTYFFMFRVVCYLKINSIEALFLTLLAWCSLTCLYITKLKCCEGYDPPDSCEEDLLDSGNTWKMCTECMLQVPTLSKHCYICNTCYVNRDHHCLWLSCCINVSNDRWFAVGIFFGSVTLSYASLLAFTTACVPQYLLPSLPLLLVPKDCTYSYHTYESAIVMSVGFLFAIFAAVMWLLVLQTVIRIARSRTLADRRYQNSSTNGQKCCNFKQTIANCFSFWFR